MTVLGNTSTLRKSITYLLALIMLFKVHPVHPFRQSVYPSQLAADPSLINPSIHDFAASHRVEKTTYGDNLPHLDKIIITAVIFCMSSIERRSHIRYDIQQEIHYINPDAPGEIFTGIIKNISHSGLCLYVLNPVRVGQEITIKSKHELYRKGTIIWFSETGENFDIYKVGLKFV